MICPVTVTQVEGLLRRGCPSCIVCGSRFPKQSLLAGHYDKEHWSIGAANPYNYHSKRSQSPSLNTVVYKSCDRTEGLDVPISHVAERSVEVSGCQIDFFLKDSFISAFYCLKIVLSWYSKR